MKKAQHLCRPLKPQCGFVPIKPWNGTQLRAMHTISEFAAIEGVVCLGHKTPQISFHEKRWSWRGWKDVNSVSTLHITKSENRPNSRLKQGLPKQKILNTFIYINRSEVFCPNWVDLCSNNSLFPLGSDRSVWANGSMTHRTSPSTCSTPFFNHFRSRLYKAFPNKQTTKQTKQQSILIRTCLFSKRVFKWQPVRMRAA